MSQGVHTAFKRFEFVKGWLTGGTDPEDGSEEVGNGTIYPLEITGTLREKFDKISEIFYRARTTVFVGGTANGYESVGPSDGTVTAPSTQLSTLSYQETGVGEQYRGYTTPVVGSPFDPSDEAIIPDAHLPYLGEEYDAGVGDMFRDTNGNEIGLFMMGESFVSLPYWNREIGVAPDFAQPLITAFSHYYAFATITGPNTDWFDYYESESETWYGAEAATEIYPAIAYVLDDPADTIYSPSTRFFLKMYFAVGGDSGIQITTNIQALIDAASLGCNYVMRLSSGDLSCPIYIQDASFFESYGGTDFIQEAVEWFPYRSYTTPAPVWDSATGEKL